MSVEAMSKDLQEAVDREVQEVVDSEVRRLVHTEVDRVYDDVFRMLTTLRRRIGIGKPYLVKIRDYETAVVFIKYSEHYRYRWLENNVPRDITFPNNHAAKVKVSRKDFILYHMCYSKLARAYESAHRDSSLFVWLRDKMIADAELNEFRTSQP